MPKKQDRRRRKDSPDLTAIDSRAMCKAIAKFNELGRLPFLQRYVFGRAKKYYLLFRERLYDSKPLVAAAYRCATGKRLRYTQFGGGGPVRAVFRKLSQECSDFREPFEDRFSELRNLTTEFDRIPEGIVDLHKLGFSDWIEVKNYKELSTRRLPGVYVTYALVRIWQHFTERSESHYISECSEISRAGV